MFRANFNKIRYVILIGFSLSRPEKLISSRTRNNATRIFAQKIGDEFFPLNLRANNPRILRPNFWKFDFD